MNQPTLKTDRLILRVLEHEDARQIQTLAGDRDVSDTLLSIPHPFEIDMAEKYVAGKISLSKSGEGVSFAIVVPAEDVLVGVVILKKIDQFHRNAEIGYWIGKDYWGKGYATEVGMAVVNYGFEVLGLHRIYAHCLSRNPSSGKVLEKLGMAYEGKLRQHTLKWNDFEDVDLYGVLRSEHKIAKVGG